jgi:serine/threonine-protein kinase RIO1
MSSNEYAISLKTNRLVKKSTANYRRLHKLGLTREINEVEEVEEVKTPAPTPTAKQSTPVLAVSTAKQPTPEFDERDLQVKMAELTTNMVADNMKKIVKSQRLSDVEYDILLKKMLYQKLCMAEPKKSKKEKPKKKAKGKKYKIVEPSSESESSDSE